MKKLTVFALLFVLTLGLLAGCRNGTMDETNTTGNTGNTSASDDMGDMGGMDSTDGDATDGDGIIGDEDDTDSQRRTRGLIPGPIHY